MKKIILFSILIIVVVIFCSCECKHQDYRAATCTEPATCLKCNATIADELGHSYTEAIIQEPTCMENGTKEFSCQMCDNKYQEQVFLTEYTANEIFELSKNSVGEIITYDNIGDQIALGTCFVLDASGQIVTNYHVIEGACSIQIIINDVTYNVKQILAYDKTIDLAVLKIDATDLSTLSICNENHPIGKTIYALGSSRGLTETFSQGIITHSSREIDGVSYVQHNAAISNGNSGGPLINAYGEVIGINTWTVKDSQNLNFAIQTSELKKLDYGTPIDMREYFEKEGAPVFRTMKKYIMKYGDYITKGNVYKMVIKLRDYDSGADKLTWVEYDVENNEMLFYHVYSTGIEFSLRIDEIDGTYDWMITGFKGDFAAGTVLANEFSENDNFIPISYYNYSDEQIKRALEIFSWACAETLICDIDEMMLSIGLSIKDLGFTNFYND